MGILLGFFPTVFFDHMASSVHTVWVQKILQRSFIMFTIKLKCSLFNFTISDIARDRNSISLRIQNMEKKSIQQAEERLFDEAADAAGLMCIKGQSVSPSKMNQQLSCRGASSKKAKERRHEQTSSRKTNGQMSFRPHFNIPGDNTTQALSVSHESNNNNSIIMEWKWNSYSRHQQQHGRLAWQ